jgi:hypothetical protein
MIFQADEKENSELIRFSLFNVLCELSITRSIYHGFHPVTFKLRRIRLFYFQHLFDSNSFSIGLPVILNPVNKPKFTFFTRLPEINNSENKTVAVVASTIFY